MSHEFEKEFDRFDEMNDHTGSKKYIEEASTVDFSYFSALVMTETIDWLEKIRAENSEASRAYLRGHFRSQAMDVLAKVVENYIHGNLVLTQVLPKEKANGAIYHAIIAEVAFHLTGEYVSHEGDYEAAFKCTRKQHQEIVDRGPRQPGEEENDTRTDKKHLH